MQTIPSELKPALADFLLAIADDKLILGHRNSDWTGLGPILEEDIAFSSLAQDNIAHASALYEFVSSLIGKNAHQIAFGRDVHAFRSAAILEGPDDFNYATALARQLFYAHFEVLRLGRVAASVHPPLAALAKRLAKEQGVQVEHVDGWIARLGQGSDEAQQRLQVALTQLAREAPMLFEMTADQQSLQDAGLIGGCGPELFEEWVARVQAVTTPAGLTVRLQPPSATDEGGRHGVHSAHLQPLLEEMTEVFRIEPEAAW
ncbi:MAG: 1,2-phenylacetyl-CoA epoxidase subunit PaaC [Phycisphaerales bacterium]